MNFRGADVSKLAAELEKLGVELQMPATDESDGSVGALLEDPDGNLIYLNTHPDEKIDRDEGIQEEEV